MDCEHGTVPLEDAPVDQLRRLVAGFRAHLEARQRSGSQGVPAAKIACMVAATSVATRVDLLSVRADLGDCKRCRLCEGRKNLVFGEGNPNAKLVFVGEAPGAEEDKVGAPFVGAAGQLLSRMIEAMGFTRDEVYICNVIKCRPPSNRDPEPDEVASCEPFLRRQLEAIGPRVIVALGRFASQTLCSEATPISRLRGQFRAFNGIPVMPTFHPSYLLRNEGNRELKALVWRDLKEVRALLQSDQSLEKGEG